MIAITNANLVLETGILWEASLLAEDEIDSIASGKKANLVFVDAGLWVKKVMLLGEIVK